MMRLRLGSRKNPARGVISIPVLAFLVVAMFFILSQAITMVGNKAIDGQLVSDSVHALYVTESGVQSGMGRLATAVENKYKFAEACALLVPGTTFSVGSGNFQFLTPSAVPTKDFCTFRVMGSVGQARRVIEVLVELQGGVGNYVLLLQRWHEVLSDE